MSGSAAAPQRRRVLAIASGGGHWIQLQRLLPALDGHELVFATVSPDYAAEVAPRELHVIPDANRDRPFRIVLLALAVLRLVWRLRPQVVVSTGAAPGLFGIVFGKLLGARTAWIDSLANVERVSLSGRLARPFADLWLTQWPGLARPGGPRYEGSVL